MSKVKGVYERFHGRSPEKIDKVHFHDPQQLVRLGRAISIVYLSDKLNGGGDGTPTEFIHEHHKDTYLYTDEKGKQLYLIGPKLKVDEAGIHG